MRPLTDRTFLILAWAIRELPRCWAATNGGVSASTTVAIAVDERSTNAPALAPQCADSDGGNAFWHVFLTLCAVLATALVVYVVWKHYWRIRHGKHLVLVTDVEKADPEFAFDNPGFRGKCCDSSCPCPCPCRRDRGTVRNERRSSDSIGRSYASHECGGDRIRALRINFADMEPKDAEDILRSASPYEIEIEIAIETEDPVRPFFRDHLQSASTGARPQVAKLAFANGSATKHEQPSSASASKPAILEVLSEVSDKMSKYGVKVLPDIGCKLNATNATTVDRTVTHVEKQTSAAGRTATAAATATASIAVSPAANSSAASVAAAAADDDDVPSASFDEVDLPLPNTAGAGTGASAVNDIRGARSVADKTNLIASFKDANVKNALVKGYQNLKERINQRVQKSNSTTTTTTTTTTTFATSGQDEEAATLYGSVRGEDVGVVDGAESHCAERIDLRLRSGSVSSNETDDSQAALKNSKRKAPRPPPLETSPPPSSGSSLSHASRDARVASGGEFNLLNEIDDQVKKNNVEESDSDDSETETRRVANATIELNASHITVHHGAEESSSSRKAASLGDLSKIEGDASRTPPPPLERAVSLELAEHTPRASKKRKAPPRPSPAVESPAADDRSTRVAAAAAVDAEPAPTSPPFGSSNLKKLSFFGALEEPASFALETTDVEIASVAPKLKKSSLFGTLEEALKPADIFSGDQHCRPFAVVASTPLKMAAPPTATTTRHHQADGRHRKTPSDVVDVNADDADSDREVAIPALPTSPIPSSLAPQTYDVEAQAKFVSADAIAAAAAEVFLADTDNIECRRRSFDLPNQDEQNATLFVTATQDDNVDDDDSIISGADVLVVGDTAATTDDIYDSRDDCSSVDTVREMSAKTAGTFDSIIAPATIAVKSAANVGNDDDHDVVIVKPMEETAADGGSDGSSTGNITDAFVSKSITRCSAEYANGGSAVVVGRSIQPNSRRTNSSGGCVGDNGTSTVDVKAKSPNATVKSPKLSQSVSPVRAVGSRIPVRANTEPSLKIGSTAAAAAATAKDDTFNKTKKYKLSEDAAAATTALENGKINNFASSSHIFAVPHKTCATISDSRLGGPNR